MGTWQLHSHHVLDRPKNHFIGNRLCRLPSVRSLGQRLRPALFLILLTDRHVNSLIDVIRAVRWQRRDQCNANWRRANRCRSCLSRVQRQRMPIVERTLWKRTGPLGHFPGTLRKRFANRELPLRQSSWTRPRGENTWRSPQTLRRYRPKRFEPAWLQVRQKVVAISNRTPTSLDPIATQSHS